MRKKKIKYTNENIGAIKIVPDFLPPPDQFAIKEETVKVTLSLNKDSVNYK